jgi:hypothetical protein
MRALRQRRLRTAQSIVVTEVTPRERRPADACVFECTRCGERYLGERSCPDCHLFNRNLGLGGPCPDCDHPIVLVELVPDLVADRDTSTASRRRT